jgi:heme-degrading monooxygenase HmoA
MPDTLLAYQEQRPMVIEHAEITVTPGQEAAFEEAFITRGHQAIAQAPGYHWARLVRQVENPGTYLLLVGWETIEPPPT